MIGENTYENTIYREFPLPREILFSSFVILMFLMFYEFCVK